MSSPEGGMFVGVLACTPRHALLSKISRSRCLGTPWHSKCILELSSVAAYLSLAVAVCLCLSLAVCLARGAGAARSWNPALEAPGPESIESDRFFN